MTKDERALESPPTPALPHLWGEGGGGVGVRKKFVVSYSSLSSLVIFMSLFVLPNSSFVDSAQAGTRTIPQQFYRGWWYVRVPIEMAECRIRWTIPYELPASVHFHLLVLPEKMIETYTGDPTMWPKGWIWDMKGLTALTHGAVVAIQAGLSMRVAPSLLQGSSGLTYSADWGEMIPNMGITLNWKWVNVESRFGYHAVTSHAAPREFLRGCRTTWLNLKEAIDLASPPAGIRTVLVAIAPYHHDLSHGDEAFTCYPPKDSEDSRTLRPRREGDYPNDPVLLWSTHHEDQVQHWKGKARVGWAKVFGALNLNMTQTAQFPQAWMASANQYTLWADRYATHTTDVGLKRLGAGAVQYIPRSLKLEEGVEANARTAVLPGSMIKAYYDTYRVGNSVNANPQIARVGEPLPGGPDPEENWEIPPVTATYQATGLPALDEPIVQLWIARKEIPFSIPGIRLWADEIENRDDGAGFKAHLNEWLMRVAQTFQFHHGVGGHLDFDTLLYVAYVEWQGPGTPRFVWQAEDGYLDFNVLVDDWLKWLMGRYPASSEFCQGILQDLISATERAVLIQAVGESGAWSGAPPDATKLRAPMAWCAVLPPLFGQLRALASPELTNLTFAWWRKMAGLMALQSEVDPAKYPWPGWFPADDRAQDASAGSWWSKYQQVPWARLMKEPTVPDWTGAQTWRFSGTTLGWEKCLQQLNAWSPQPPSTPASNDAEKFSNIVLPTGAYPMGPIEIKFRP